jgi:hypothetical protein
MGDTMTLPVWLLRVMVLVLVVTVVLLVLPPKGGAV